MKNRIYLDYAATAPILPTARAKMLEVLDAQLGNPAALHTPGHFAQQYVEAARLEIARLLAADPTEIIFTSGGSESNNTVMQIFAGQKIAVSSVEHPSVLEAARARAGELRIIPVDREGLVQVEKIPSDVDLVSIMLANNELGNIEPIAEITQRLRQQNPHIRIHTDATQAFGKIPVKVDTLGVDYLTISAHKIGGPVGVGALYARNGAPFQSLILGGHQELKRRAGTVNACAIAGFGAAAQWCWKNWSCRRWAEVAKLRDLLARRIQAEVTHSSINSPREHCLPNILNVSFEAAEGESIQLYLDAAGVVVSTGSACAAGDTKPSHVLMATQGDPEVAHSSIRFSLGLDTAEAEIDQVMQVLPDIVKRLQGISTVKIRSNQ